MDLYVQLQPLRGRLSVREQPQEGRASVEHWRGEGESFQARRSGEWPLGCSWEDVSVQGRERVRSLQRKPEQRTAPASLPPDPGSSGSGLSVGTALMEAVSWGRTLRTCILRRPLGRWGSGSQG